MSSLSKEATTMHLISLRSLTLTAPALSPLVALAKQIPALDRSSEETLLSTAAEPGFGGGWVTTTGSNQIPYITAGNRLFRSET